MSLKNFTLLSLIILSFTLFVNAIAITPSGLLFGRSVIVNSSLYYCGAQNNSVITPQLFMLDLSTPFVTSAAPWQLIPTTGNGESVVLAAVFTYNGNIWRQGGNSTNGEPMSNLQEYNVNTRAWSNPPVQTQAGSNTPPSLADHSVVVNISTGIAYFFGGTQYSTAKDLNTVFTLDINKLIYNYPNPTGTPPIGLEGHKAILINGLMYILGGFQRSTQTFALFSQVPIYNTITNSWTTSSTSGQAPVGRQELTAVILPDGVSILVFGGTAYPLVEVSYNDVNVLHTSNMTWSTPLTTGGAPTARDGHAAIMVGSQFIVMFGEEASQVYLSNMGILDTSSWTWENTFVPAPNAITGPNYNGNPSSASDYINSNNVTNGGSNNNSSNSYGNGTNIHVIPDNPGDNNTNPNPSNSLFTPVGGIGGLAGIIAGTLAFLALAGFAIYCFFCRSKHRQRPDEESKEEEYGPPTPSEQSNVVSSPRDSGNVGSVATGTSKSEERPANKPYEKKLMKPNARGPTIRLSYKPHERNQPQ